MNTNEKGVKAMYSSQSYTQYISKTENKIGVQKLSENFYYVLDALCILFTLISILDACISKPSLKTASLERFLSLWITCDHFLKMDAVITLEHFSPYFPLYS